MSFLGYIYETEALTSYLEQFSNIYKCNVEEELEAFKTSEPTIDSFQEKFSELQKIDEHIEAEPDHYIVGALYIGLEDFRRKIKTTLNALKQVGLHYPPAHV